MADRVPAKPKESHRRSLITKWHKEKLATGYQPLKRFVASLTDDEGRIQREDWLHNKRANFGKPPRKIGRTRTRVKSGGNKGAVKKLDGK